MFIACVNVYNFGLLCVWTCPLSSMPAECDVSVTRSVSVLGCADVEVPFKMGLMLNTGPSSVSGIQRSLLNAREEMKFRNSAMPSSVDCLHDPLEFNSWKPVNCGHIREVQRWPCVVSQQLCAIAIVFE
jgi:hypothetical protein